MSAVGFRSRFIHGLEARYAEGAERLKADGLDPEAAHKIAFDEVKDFGRRALEQLRHRGHFPWSETERVEPWTADVRVPNRTGGNA